MIIFFFGGKIFWIYIWFVFRIDLVFILFLLGWYVESKEFEFGQVCDYEDCVLDNMFIKCDLYSFFRKFFKYININEYIVCCLNFFMIMMYFLSYLKFFKWQIILLLL